MPEQIRPSQLAPGTPPADAAVIFDNGVSVLKGTPIGLVDAATPLATQTDAELGTDNTKRMTPLRVAQATANKASTTDLNLVKTDAPVGIDRFAGGTPAAKLSAAITAQIGKTVTIVNANDTTALPSDYTGAAIQYAADRRGRWTHTADTFGKARRTLKAQHPVHNGEAMASYHIETEALGNQNFPANADYAMSLAITKKGFGTGAASGGEIDGLTIFVRNDGRQGAGYNDTDRADAAGILINAQKVGTCGWIGGIEMGVSELNPTTFAINRQIQAAIGVITGADDNKAYGLTAAALYGACNDGVLIYEDAATNGTWANLIRGFKADGRGIAISVAGDMVATTAAWSSFAWRLQRGNDTNGILSLEQRGSGGILLSASDAASIVFATNSIERARFIESGSFVPGVNLQTNIGEPNRRFSTISAYQLNMGADASDGRIFMFLGSSPEGVLAANVGSLVVNTAGGSGTRLYSKATGTGNTGWVAIA